MRRLLLTVLLLVLLIVLLSKEGDRVAGLLGVDPHYYLNRLERLEHWFLERLEDARR